MIVLHKLEMDLTGQGTEEQIHVVQGDANTRVLEIHMHCGGEDWEIPQDAQVRMRYCKSDGKKGVYDTLPDGSCAWSKEENVLTMVLAPQMLTIAGLVLAQIELTEGTDALGTFVFRIRVEENPGAGALGSEDYINMLHWMGEELDRRLEQARDSGDFTGPRGPAGREVYDVALDAGYTGTEAEFAQKLITPCLPLAGGTMTGTLDMGGQQLTGLVKPTESTHAATKAYVDGKRSYQYVTLNSNAWTPTAPYMQQVPIKGNVYITNILATPCYSMVPELDQATRAAWNCIDYVAPYGSGARVVCLDQKPETEITLLLDCFF